MSIKSFGGLGGILSRFVIGGNTNTSSPGNFNRTVDHAIGSPIGNHNLPKSLSPIGNLINIDLPISTPDSTVADRNIFSRESSDASYETLFNDFNLEAYPFYNFWVADELIDDNESRGKRKLEDIPRYIKVSWNIAPDLSKTNIANHDVTIHDIPPARPVTDNGITITVNGINFVPEHLQQHNFSEALNNLANGYINPGAINGIVEMPLHNAGLDSHMSHAKTSHIHHIDEDAFLTHPSTVGISIHEIKANINHMTNGALGAAQVASSQLSTNSRNDRDTFFNGKFSVNKSPFTGGRMRIDGVHSSSPPLSIIARTAVSNKNHHDHVIGVVKNIVKSQHNSSIKNAAFAKVNFTNSSIDGIVSSKKVNLMTEPHHVETMVSIANVLPQLEVLSRRGSIISRNSSHDMIAKIPSFDSHKSLPPLEYIGYVLEKYKRMKSGVFELVEEIKLSSRDCDQYYDTRVLYGEVYRYRIKSIIRWTHPDNIGKFGQDNFKGNLFAPYVSSYFASEWNNKWAYASLIDTTPPDPPDELTVRPESHRKRIAITFRLPHNPQRDIFKMRLFRKLQDSEGHDLTNWIQVKEQTSQANQLTNFSGLDDNPDAGIDFGPRNVLYFDTDVDFFQTNGIRYVYAAQSVSRHHECSYISEQIGVKLNKDYKINGEYKADFVSSAGVKLEHFGAFSVNPPRRTRREIITHVNSNEYNHSSIFSLSPRDGASDNMRDNATYYLRIESLDTGEIKDYRLELKYLNLKQDTRTISSTVYIPTHSVQDSRPRTQAPNADVPISQQTGPIRRLNGFL